MTSVNELREHYQSLLDDGLRLAGGLTDLAQRATVYHHLFEHSGRNHVFPLIAAHGALWARGYFAFGMKLGWLCSLQYVATPSLRRRRLQELAEFADAFRDINRRVCVDTYASYHFTLRHGDHPRAGEFIEPLQLDALNRCHAARRKGQQLSTDEQREVFKAFFLNEQEHVVGPSVEAATLAFHWPLMRMLALRPMVRFAYFGHRSPFFFRNFAIKEERIEKGLRAFNMGADVGWERVEAALRDYDVLPAAFFAGSRRYFEQVREAVLSPAEATAMPSM